MRNIINISLPKELAITVRQEVKRGKFATTSEYFRHLVRFWNSYNLAQELDREKKKFEAGKFKILRSLKDLR